MSDAAHGRNSSPALGWALCAPVPEDELVRSAERVAEEGEALVPDGIPVSSRTAEGHPGTEILKRVEAANHDLIVMGSRGFGAVRSAVLDSSSTTSSTTPGCPC